MKKTLDEFIEKHKSKKWFVFMEQMRVRFEADGVTEIGAQLTFYLILALFPFIIFFLSILQFTPLADADILQQLLSPLPGESKILFYELINDIIKNGSIGLLSVGAIGSVWASSNGTMAIIKAVNRAFGLKETRSFIQLKGLSILFTFGLFLILIVTFTILIFGEIIFEAIFASYTLPTIALWRTLKFLIPLVFMILSLTALYKFSPAEKKDKNIKFSESIPGAIFAGVFWVVLSTAFSFYVNHFGNYSKTYGSLGGVIVFLLWLYMSSIVIVLGAEVNATLLAMNTTT